MVNGIINIYKEKGFTSFDVVAKMRGIAHQKKIGHTGTLDPDACGVLPVCLGKATKVCDLLTDKDKVYEAVLLLGKQTDTQDISGEVIHSCEVEISKEEVKQAILSFVGSYEQVPPMYSALKVDGQKLCDLARKGITVERKARSVQIFDIEILDITLPRAKMLVHCSKGTYIRTLCDDIGNKLGCYGCMESLLRTKVADFTIDKAYTLAQVEEYFQNDRIDEILYPVDFVFSKYPKAVAKEEARKLIDNGNRIPKEFVVESLSDDFDCEEMPICLYDEANKFIGLYSFKVETNDYKPIKLFMD